MDAVEKDMLIENIWETIEEAQDLDSDDKKYDIIIGLASLGESVAALPVKKAKRKWVKEWRKEKEERGSYSFLNRELLVNDEQSFKNYLRVSKSQFDFLLSLIDQDIQRSNTILRCAIPSAEKLAMTLRFLATGETFVSLDYQTRLSKSSISKIVPEVCDALYKHLKTTYLKFPSSCEDWENIAKDFAVKWQFPNCLGALDGKHITFRPLRKDGAYYHNYKGTNSIILLALVDASCRFIFVDVGCNGRTNDSGVFLQSKLNNVLEEKIYIPQPCAVGNRQGLPYVVVADDAFPLRVNILKPYPYNSKLKEKQTFNYRFSRARHVVEHAFGILSNRFRVFLAPINLKVDTVQQIVLTCCVLHNYLISSGEVIAEWSDNEVNSNDSQSSPTAAAFNARRGEAEKIRQQFMDYFNEEGRLDWLHS